MSWFTDNSPDTQEGLLPNESTWAGPGGLVPGIGGVPVGADAGPRRGWPNEMSVGPTTTGYQAPGGQLTPNGSNVPGQYWPSQGQSAPFDPASSVQMGTYTGGGQYPLASVMGTGLMQPWTTPFQAPNDVTQQNDPGWQFRMNEGQKAIERSSAAKGTLLTGGTLKDLAGWSQDYASNEYDRVYGRALGEYQQAYNIFGNNQANQYNRLAGLSSQGQNAAAGMPNQQYAQNASNQLTDNANVLAAGRMASANAWGNAASGIGSNVANAYLWSQYGNPNPYTTSGYYNPNTPNTYYPNQG